MNILEMLADERVREYYKKGKVVSFELARLAVQAETFDRTIGLLVLPPENYPIEDLADLLRVSVRFVEISFARYTFRKGNDVDSDVELWEQIMEMRKEDDPESEWSEERLEHYKKEISLRLSEMTKLAKMFLAKTNYTDKRIADLVGLSGTFIHRLRQTGGKVASR